MKKLILLLFVCIPVLSMAQEVKNYHISGYRIETRWQDTLWIPGETGEDTKYTCHVNYDEIGIWGKFVIKEKIYHVYGELQKKEIDLETFHVTYYGKGKLVYDNEDIEVVYWETMHELDSIYIVLDDRRVFFELEDY
jgi:hypothetical protein